MTTRIRFTRTKLAGAASVTVAAFLAAAALPASALAAPTINAVPLSGLSDDYLQVAPAADGGASEWVTAESQSTNGAVDLDAVSASGAVSSVSVGGAGLGDSSGSPTLIVNDGTLDWVFGPNGLSSLNSAAFASSPTVVDGGIGLVVDASGNVYTSDDNGDLEQCVVSSGTPVCTDDTVAGSTLFNQSLFAGGPDALAYADGSVWAVAQGDTSTPDLFSVSTGGDFATNQANGPYGSAGLQSAPGTAIVGDGDDVYGASFGDSGVDIYEFNAADPSASPTVYATGLPADADIQSLAVGSDGNIWFVDVGSEAIGELDTSTGAITEYALPSGYEFQQNDTYGFEAYNQIAIGPSGSGTLFATAQNTTTGGAAVIEVSGVAVTSSSTNSGSGGTGGTTPTPVAKLTITSKATVSSKREAELKLTCTTAACKGKLTLTAKVKVKKGKKTKTETVTLGSVSYSVAAGKKKTVDLKLSSANYKRLEATSGHKLKATVAIKPTGGTKSSATVTLVGPKPKK